MVKKVIPIGSIRIKANSLQTYKKFSEGYVKVNRYTKINNFDKKNIENIIKIYKEHDKLKYLIDSKEPEFLKGYIKPDGKICGERVIFLYNDKKLNKAFSLFSPHLTIHDEKRNSHWDVIYQNPNGEYAYIYTIDKIEKSQKEKYRLVEEFEERLPRLNRNILLGLKEKENIALPMYTLLKTYMRVGNETYFRENGHQGIITLQKKNILISRENVTFNFLSKDGVPQKIEVNCPEIYIKNLNLRLKKIKEKDFVFCDNNYNKLDERDLEEAFKKYCGKEFYPHIVRSYYATKRIEDFIKKNPHPNKKEVRDIYNEIAEKLGHKKFSKKKMSWEPSHTVTVAHYISPKLVNKIKKIVK